MRRLKARFLAGFLFLAMALSGCAVILPQSYALKEQRPSDLPVRAELTDVPFFAQEEYQCGPAALAMALNAAGVSVTPDALVNQVYIPARQGSLQVEMLAAARRRGLIAYELEPQLTDVLREVAAGTPVIVLENYGFRIRPLWHYAVVVGYDLEEGRTIRRSGTKQRQTMPFAVFEYVWKDEGRWSMVAVPPDRLPATATEARYSSAAVALEKSGQISAAHTAYNTLLRRWPGNLAGLMGRGNTAYALKDFATAESAFRQAAQDHTHVPAAFNNLAQVLSDRGRLDEAIATAERAVSLGGPLLPATRTTLEEIRLKAKTSAQYRLEIQQLLKAVPLLRSRVR
ncbi:MAG: PA2778 family cysteine peptidase [Pseudomonadota bacterium]